ncbi:MAG: 5-oxoprolinase/urea amidolyase family protein [candidate division NC10 bacterium]|nr:5-oxoprolinase/urea amidolyase family protein [candidate division NC10 bacterium]
MAEVLRVIEPGILTTVQDLGRPGYQKFGIPVSGALDPVALRLANALVGNPPGAAALEVTGGGVTLEALGECVVAVVGADLPAFRDDTPVPCFCALRLIPGQRLRLGAPRVGLRTYLALHGGLEVPAVLGSRSTCPRLGFGGLAGRALRAGDVFEAGPATADFGSLRGRHLPPAGRPVLGSPWVVRAVPGPQEDAFAREALDTFFGSAYEVTPHTDRMGMRLTGPPLAHRRSADILSDAIPLGAIQVPGEGLPILLLADRQTTGGYPKIATAIGPDVATLAQARPGDAVRFVRVIVEEAHAAAREAAERLARLEAAIAASAAEQEYTFTLEGEATRATVRAVEEGWLVAVQGEHHLVGRPAAVGEREAGAVLSPLPGLVVAVHVREGEAVRSGTRLLTLSAMKMEHTLTAPTAGTVAEIRVRPQQTVAVGDLLLRLEPSPQS